MACPSVDQPKTLDVAIGDRLDPRDHVRMLVGPEEVLVAPLRPEVVLDRAAMADLRDAGDFAVLGLEDREQPGLLRKPRDLDRGARLAAPAERARHKDVEVARAA